MALEISSKSFPEPLAQLSNVELAVLNEYLTTVHFEEKSCIFREGSPGDCLYLIDQGSVRIQLDREELDVEAVLSYVDSGMILGELAVLDREPRSASAYAETKVVARRLRAEDLDRLSEEHPRVALAVVHALGRSAAATLRRNTSRLASILFPRRIPEVDQLVARAQEAHKQFISWSERKVEALLLDLATAVAKKGQYLAEVTVKSTGLGRAQDKALKNQLGSLLVVKSLLNRPGIGVIGRDEKLRVTEVASPIGVIFGLIPVTSPVATAIFKILIALKARNAIILSPHRMALEACQELAGVVDEILAKHSAPVGIVSWVTKRSNREKTRAFMTHEGVGLILATGGSSMVREAYSSGTPAIGVGPGNAPVLVAPDADLNLVAANVVLSKPFDNGLICGGENNLVVTHERRESLIAALERHGAAVLDNAEMEAFSRIAIDPEGKRFRHELIGQTAARIADFVGIKRDRRPLLLVAPTDECSHKNPFAREKMTPLVSLFTVKDVEEGLTLCKRLLEIEGTGHTAVIYTQDKKLVQRFGSEMPASRILVNTPAVHGIVGMTTGLPVSFTLGCGTFGGTSTTDNVGVKNVMNIKRIAEHDDEKELICQFMAHVNPAAGILAQILGFDSLEVEAEGCVIRDSKGREYLDCLAGFGVQSLGHRHPRVIAAVKEQLDKIAFSSRVLFNEKQIVLAQILAEITPGDLQFCFFCNSGTEAVEGALKMARFATGRPRIISAQNSFHGKTFGALSASGRDVFKKPFAPLVPGFDQVPFNDSDALRSAMGPDVAAVILEPVQGEGGVYIASNEYMHGAGEVCKEHGALLIIDEVQTGFGRTGKMFACEHSGIEPDLLCLAKALSGGVIPIGAIVGTSRCWRMFEQNPFMHSSTFGGNPLACAAGIAAIRVIQDEKLASRAATVGLHVVRGLRAIQARYPEAIREIRGLGLLIGVEFEGDELASHVIAGMVKRGVIAAYTLNQPRVIRFEPPLVISVEQCDRAIEVFAEAVEETMSQGE